ncbi:MAG: response regulator, partial [Chloroflexota bacterium]|nr:response regulator [Chloroflexota bacterium]
MIRVLLAEDQLMFRTALRRLLELEDDIEVVAEVARGDELVAAALAARPDVAVVDIEMPGQDGISAVAELRHTLPSCRTLILTMYGRPGYVRRAMDGGVFGFVLKDAPVEVLAVAIRRCAAGEEVIDP